MWRLPLLLLLGFGCERGCQPDHSAVQDSVPSEEPASIRLGLVESFAAAPYDAEERLELMELMAAAGMDAWLYAPWAIRR